MSTLLKGVAFITGGGSGIGQATAYALVRHGIRKLAISDIRPESLDTTSIEIEKMNKDVEILKIQIDTSSEDTVKAAISKVVEHFGRLDIAVNNAGVGGAHHKSQDIPLDEWQKVMSINLNGVFLSQKAEIQQMLKQDPLDPLPRGNRGVIVNVASMYGVTGASPSTMATAYTASKHGVMGLTKADALAYAPEGIRINAICPGYVATPLLKSMQDTLMADEVKKVPQGRLAEMDEIGDCIMFLASPLSSFMAGTGLVVDGGFTAGHY